MNEKKLKDELTYNENTGEFKWNSSKSGIKKSRIAGYTDAQGYVIIEHNKKQYKAHRLAWLYVHGEWPEHQIDHINGKRDDNRIENLRDVSQAHNTKNRAISTRNKSGIIGVRWIKKERNYQAYIMKNYKSYSLYYGKDFFEACCRRKSAERRLGFHENHGRTLYEK